MSIEKFLVSLLLFIAVYIATILTVGKLFLEIIGNHGGAFSAVVITGLGMISNTLLLIILSVKYKYTRLTKIAGIIALFLYIPALLLINTYLELF